MPPPPNPKLEILDVLAPFSIISVFTVLYSGYCKQVRDGYQLVFNGNGVGIFFHPTTGRVSYSGAK